MKILKIKFCLISLATIFATSIFFTSCQQDALDLSDRPDTIVEEPSFEHSKRMELTSDNGLNKVSISVLSNDESLLQNVRSEDLKIVPIFEKPSESPDPSTDNGNTLISEDTDQTQLAFVIEDVELEAGAIGYVIDVTTRADNNRGWKSVNFYTSRRGVWVNSSKGYFAINVYHKYSPNSSYKRVDTHFLCHLCGYGYKVGYPYRMRVRLTWNTSYGTPKYSLGFYN